VEPFIFEQLLEFVYGNKFMDSIPQAIKLLQLAHKYEVKPLVEKCEQLMSEDVRLEDALQTFVVARKYSLEKLMKQAGDLITRFVMRGQDINHGGKRPAKLCSILLQGLDYDLLRAHWPSGRPPSADNQVTVHLETIQNGVQEEIFAGECLLRKGIQLELKVQPPVTLKNDTMYHIRVYFQGEILVISNPPGQRGHYKPGYDLLTKSTLRKTASGDTTVGLVRFDGLQVISPPARGTLMNACNQQTKPLGLHIVKGVTLV